MNDTDLMTGTHDPALLASAASVLASIRGAKSIAKVSQKTEATAVTVRGPQDQLDALGPALDDVRAAGKVIGELSLVVEPVEHLSVEVTLAD